jgi:hypothetical protein
MAKLETKLETKKENDHEKQIYVTDAVGSFADNRWGSPRQFTQ